jgi:uncharacterized DUF497 family protein
MDVYIDLNGVRFSWDLDKARRNLVKHDGIAFERAVEAFFDPFLRLVDAARNDEARNAVIGRDVSGRLLYVVHLEINEEVIRIISARRATLKEREYYDS